MNRTVLTAILGLALLAVPTTPSVDPDTAPTINAVVGDASFVATFGRAPDAATDEDLRIRTHLAWVLGKLRAAPVPHPTAEQREARARNLDRLAGYVAAGVFPRNPASVKGRTPNFIDDQGRICAVGHLLRADLGAAAASAIRDRFQFARIVEMSSDVLAAWQRSSGLTVRELATIQPAYCGDGVPCDDPGFIDEMPRASVGLDGANAAAIGSSVASLVLAGMNGTRTALGKPSRTLAWMGIGAGVAGGFVAALDGNEAPVVTAGTAFVSAVLGLASLQRHTRSAAAASPPSMLSLAVAPTASQGNAVVVQWRF
jgi:hypothetical protein